jgi:hypothetical protein
MLTLRVVCGLLFAASAVCGISAARVDRRLQEFRLPGATSAVLQFVPARWQRRFYVPEAHSMVARAWRLTASMYGFAAVAIAIIAVASH